jgi:hypothetical protein
MIYTSPNIFQNASKNFDLTLQNDYNVVLSNKILDLGWNGHSKVNINVLIPQGVAIGSLNTALAALRPGTLPEGSTFKVEIHGEIIGKGGTGGFGTEQRYARGGNGTRGGTGFTSEGYECTINNFGRIAGGGGGGAGSGNEAPNGETYDDPGGSGGGRRLATWH